MNPIDNNNIRQFRLEDDTLLVCTINSCPFLLELFNVVIFLPSPAKLINLAAFGCHSVTRRS